MKDISGTGNTLEQHQDKYVDVCQRSVNSKCIITQVQYRTGRTEALLTMIIVREHLDSISPSAALMSPKRLQRSSLPIVSGKKTQTKPK